MTMTRCTENPAERAFYAALGGNIYRARQERDLSRAEVSERVNCDPAAVFRWEMGHFRASPHQLARLASVLAVPISTLFEGLEPLAEAARLARPSLDDKFPPRRSSQARSDHDEAQ
jgi:transcriptional regulator with XRE-family HTH domain